MTVLLGLTSVILGELDGLPPGDPGEVEVGLLLPGDILDRHLGNTGKCFL